MNRTVNQEIALRNLYCKSTLKIERKTKEENEESEKRNINAEFQVIILSHAVFCATTCAAIPSSR